MADYTEKIELELETAQRCFRAAMNESKRLKATIAQLREGHRLKDLDHGEYEKEWKAEILQHQEWHAERDKRNAHLRSAMEQASKDHEALFQAARDTAVSMEEQRDAALHDVDHLLAALESFDPNDVSPPELRGAQRAAKEYRARQSNG